MIFVQVVFASLVAIPIIWGLFNRFKYKGVAAPKIVFNYATMINSAVFYALAFNIIFFLQEVYLVLGKKAIGLKSTLYHNNHTWEGDHPLVSLMQGSGALGIFLTGLICLAIYLFIRNSNNIWKLLILWLAFHGLVQSIPQVIIGYLSPSTDVGDALVGYLQLSEPILIFLSIVSAVAQVSFCIWFSRHLLEFAPSHADLNNPKVKLRYVRYIAVGAAILGSVLVIPFRILPMSQAVTPFIVTAFSIPWVWAASARSKAVRHTPNKINDKVFWGPIIFLVLFLIFFRLILVPGVEF